MGPVIGPDVAGADFVGCGEGVGDEGGSCRGAAVPVAARAWGLNVSVGDRVNAGEATGLQAAVETEAAKLMSACFQQ